MKLVLSVWFLLIIALAAAGCNEQEGNVPEPGQGPALIMFYTDG